MGTSISSLLKSSLANPSISDDEKVSLYEAYKKFAAMQCAGGGSIFPDSIAKRNVSVRPFSLRVEEFDPAKHARKKLEYERACATFIMHPTAAVTGFPFQTIDFKSLCGNVDFDFSVGSGKFGIVCLGKIRSNGKPVALKFTRTRGFITDIVYQNPYIRNHSVTKRPIVEALISSVCSRLDRCFSQIGSFAEVLDVNLITLMSGTGGEFEYTSFEKKSTRFDSAIVLFMEPFQKSLADERDAVPTQVLFQTLYCIYRYQSAMLGFHGDFHNQNCMINKCDDTRTNEYNIDGKIVVFPEDKSVEDYRVVMVDMGFARSDILFGKGTSARDYQHLLFIFMYEKRCITPMHFCDVFKLSLSMKFQPLITQCVRYLRFVYQQVFERIFPDTAFMPFPEKFPLTMDDLRELLAYPPVNKLLTIITETLFLPPEFKQHSTDFVQKLLFSIRRPSYTAPPLEPLKMENERYDFTHTAADQLNSRKHPFVVIDFEHECDGFVEKNAVHIMEHFRNAALVPIESFKLLLKHCLRKYGLPIVIPERTKQVYDEFSFAYLCKFEESKGPCKLTLELSPEKIPSADHLRYLEYITINHGRPLDESGFKILELASDVIASSVVVQRPEAPALSAIPEENTVDMFRSPPQIRRLPVPTRAAAPVAPAGPAAPVAPVAPAIDSTVIGRMPRPRVNFAFC